MNNIQRNFKKQIAQSLHNEEKKARKGKGVFSNNLFSLRFYGYNNTSNYIYKPLPIRIFTFILRLILFIIKAAFMLALFLIIIKLLLIIKNNVNGYT